MFFDYNWRLKRRSNFVSATAIYPMWAGLTEPVLAKASFDAVLAKLEAPGGILSTEKALGPVARQWDYPNGWAPHQMIVWQALENYGQNDTMHRLIYKWLYMITKNAADYNGVVPEKYDVVQRSHKVFAEYGNVGTEFSYITQEGFGWMNASYQVGLSKLPAPMIDRLKKLTPFN